MQAYLLMIVTGVLLSLTNAKNTYETIERDIRGDFGKRLLKNSRTSAASTISPTSASRSVPLQVSHKKTAKRDGVWFEEGLHVQDSYQKSRRTEKLVAKTINTEPLDGFSDNEPDIQRIPDSQEVPTLQADSSQQMYQIFMGLTHENEDSDYDDSGSADRRMDYEPSTTTRRPLEDQFEILIPSKESLFDAFDKRRSSSGFDESEVYNMIFDDSLDRRRLDPKTKLLLRRLQVIRDTKAKLRSSKTRATGSKKWHRIRYVSKDRSYANFMSLIPLSRHQ